MQKGRAPLPGLPFHPHQRVEFAECITDSAAVEAGYKLPVVEVDLEVVVRRRTAACSSLHLELLRDLCHTMKFGSLCALGGFIPYPVMSALEHFPEDFHAVHREAAE